MKWIRKARAVQASEAEIMNIKRVFPSFSLSYIDPFLVMDHFSVSRPAGFPTHPHRGFEIITYMINGAFAHEDSTGQRGVIKAGGLQRITAGKGVEHSEFPVDQNKNEGFQLWINLPRADKKIEPDYQEVRAEEIPESVSEGVTIRTLVGEGSPVTIRRPMVYYDIQMEHGSNIKKKIPHGYQGLIYIIEGKGQFGFGDETAGEAEILVFHAEDKESEIRVTSDAQLLRFLLIAGEPIGEKPRFNGSFVD